MLIRNLTLCLILKRTSPARSPAPPPPHRHQTCTLKPDPQMHPPTWIRSLAVLSQSKSLNVEPEIWKRPRADRHNLSHHLSEQHANARKWPWSTVLPSWTTIPFKKCSDFGTKRITSGMSTKRSDFTLLPVPKAVGMSKQTTSTLRYSSRSSCQLSSMPKEYHINPLTHRRYAWGRPHESKIYAYHINPQEYDGDDAGGHDLSHR